MPRHSRTVLVAVAILATACTTPSGERSATSPTPTGSVTAGDEEPSLAGTSWRLTYVDGRAWPVGAAPDITLAFRDRRLGGFSGCNEFGTRWEMSGGTLDVGRIASTLILCQGEVAFAERRLLRILAASPRVSVQPDELRLTALPEGVLVFAPAER